MNETELALLAKAGAGAAVAFDPVAGAFPANTVRNAATGFARCVHPDGSVQLTAFLFDGSRVDVTVPAP
jgi:hypothetical protein